MFSISLPCRRVLVCMMAVSGFGSLPISAAHAANTSTVVARIEQIQPPVWVERMGVRAAAKPGWALYAGDWLTTGRGGRVQVALAGGAQLAMGESADVTLGPSKARDTLFDVARGVFRFAAPAEVRSPIGIGEKLRASVQSGEIWGSADSKRDQIGLIHGAVDTSIGTEAPTRLDRPDTVFSLPRDGSPAPAATMPREQLAWWLAQLDFTRGRPLLAADGGWAVTLMASEDIDAARATACRVHDRGYPAELVTPTTSDRTGVRLIVRRFASEVDARAFVAAAGEMRFKQPVVLTPAEVGGLGATFVACAQSLTPNEMWIAKAPATPIAATEMAGSTAEGQVRVRRFLVEGVQAHPDAGISPESVQAVADQAFARLAGGKPEVTLPVSQMEAVADEVKAYYRKLGYVVAFAYVPAQTVAADGVVKIRLHEGRLESVVVDGAQHYSASTLSSPAKPLVNGVPTQESVEEAVLLAQDYPGVRLSGVLRPGARPGDTQLVLKVSEEDAAAFSLGADNYGSENSGEIRLHAGATWNSPTGFGDRLDLSVLQSVSPTDTTSGSLNYEVPMGVPSLRFNAGIARNAFQVTEGPFKALQLEGTIDSVHAGSTWRFKRSRAFNARTGLSYTQKKSELTALSSLAITDDQLQMAAVNFSFDHLDTVLHGADDASLNVRQAVGGHYEPAGGTEQKPDFTVFDARYTRLQALTETQSLVLSLRAQHTGDTLSVLEQFPLSGPGGVRAYPVGDFLRDKGQAATAEYRVNAPGFASAPGPFGRTWGQLLQFRLFYDYASGEQANPPTSSSGTSKVDASGAGLGIQFGAPDSFRVLLQGASRLSGPTPSDGSDFRVFGEFKVPL